MTYVPDLMEPGPIRSVGYLSKGHDYPQGEVPEEVFDRLVNLVTAHIKLHILHYMGYHNCDLERCGSNQPEPEVQYHGLVIPRRCRSDLLVPDREVLYVAPALIMHYIRHHRYLPPACFLEAVLNCPEPGSQDFLAAVEKVWPHPSW